MKYWKNWLLFVFTLCVALQTAAFSEERPAATAYRAESPVVIDGKLDEWKLDSPIAIEDASQVIRDGNVWQGPADCSCKAYVMWDAENLYLAVDVNEDTPFGAIEMLPLDGEDNFKLYLSTNPAADPARTAYETNDFLVYFIVDNQYWDTAIDRSMVPKEARQRFISKGMSGGESVLDGYQCAAQTTDTGFLYEAVIPWANFSNDNIPVYTPKTGDKIQFDFAIYGHLLSLPGHRIHPAAGMDRRFEHQRQPEPVGHAGLSMISAICEQEKDAFLLLFHSRRRSNH